MSGVDARLSRYSYLVSLFPRALARLRRWEPALSRVPLGAQYCVLAGKAG